MTGFFLVHWLSNVGVDRDLLYAILVNHYDKKERFTHI